MRHASHFTPLFLLTTPLPRRGSHAELHQTPHSLPHPELPLAVVQLWVRARAAPQPRQQPRHHPQELVTNFMGCTTPCPPPSPPIKRQVCVLHSKQHSEIKYQVLGYVPECR